MNSGNKAGDMSVKVNDYQPGMDQFAGEEFGKTNMYMERHDREVTKEAKKLKAQRYMGRYD